MTYTKIQTELLSGEFKHNPVHKSHTGSDTNNLHAIGTSTTPISKANVMVFIDNEIIPQADFSISGTNIVLNAAQTAASDNKSVEIVTHRVSLISIVNGQLATDRFSTGCVDDTKLASNAATSAKLVDESVTSAKLGTDSVQLGQFSPSSIEAAAITNSTIEVAKFSPAFLSSIHNKKKNYLDNPDMRIAQRASSSVITNDKVVAIDRWTSNCDTNGIGYIIRNRSNETTGIDYYLHFAQATTPTNRPTLTQHVEGINKFNGKLVTLSAWIKCDQTVQVEPILRRTYSAGNPVIQSLSSDFTVGTTWKRYSATATIADLQSTALESTGVNSSEFGFRLPAGKQGYKFHITNVQLEDGHLSPFMYVDHVKQIKRCERFYEKSYNLDTYTGTKSMKTNYEGVKYIPKLHSLTAGNLYGSFKFRTEKIHEHSSVLTLYHPSSGAEQEMELFGKNAAYTINLNKSFNGFNFGNPGMGGSAPPMGGLTHKIINLNRTVILQNLNIDTFLAKKTPTEQYGAIFHYSIDADF